MNSDRDLDKLTEELFAEAKNERPTEAVKERVLATVLKTPTPGAGAHATSTWMWWVGAASLLAMGLAIGLSGTSGAEAPAPPSAPSLLVVEADPAPSLPPGPAEPAVTATPVDAREGPPAPRVAPRSQPAPAGPEEDALEKELALLDEARRAVSTAPAKALAALDEHSKRFPRGGIPEDRGGLVARRGPRELRSPR